MSKRGNRLSILRGNDPIPVGGVIGRLGCSGKLGGLADYLAICETCNIGSHAALGLGWYDLVLYP